MRIGLKYKLGSCLLFMTLFLSAQKQLDSMTNSKLVERLNKLAENRSSQNIYVQTDKYIYETGEDLWFKAYVLNSLDQTPSNESHILFVQLMRVDDNEIVYEEKHEIKNGISSGHVFLKENLENGSYYLMAHTVNSINNHVEDIRSFKKIEIKKSIVPDFFVDLEFDKKNYTEKDTVNIRIEVLTRRKENIHKARIEVRLYENENRVNSKRAKTDENGIAQVSFNLEEKGVGDRIEVVISKDQKKEILSYKLPLKASKKSIQFGLFPEGGSLVADLESNIAFKAVSDSGDPIDIQGVVYENNQPIKNISSSHDGMGKFLLKPKPNANYFVKIESPQIDSAFVFPKIKSAGIALKTKKRTENEIQFQISKSPQLEAQRIYVRGQMRGKVIWMAQGELNSSYTNFSIPLKDVPQGIIELTVFNSNYNPIIERLIYVNSNERLHIDEIRLSKEYFKTKDKVEIKFSVLDAENNPVQANLGLTVFNHLRNEENYVHGIFSHNYLLSEIKGRIHNPKQYFNANNENREKVLDLLLLTQGWRNYNWSENALKKINPQPINRFLSEDLYVKVYGKSSKGTLNNLNKAVDVQIMSPSFVDIVKTNNSGVLKYSSQVLKELKGYQMFFKTLNDTLVFKNTDQFKELNAIVGLKQYPYHMQIETNEKNSNSKVLDEFSFNSTNYLDEVEVVAYKKRKAYLGSASKFESSHSDYICWNYGILNCVNHRGGPTPIVGERYKLNSGEWVQYEAPVQKTKKEEAKPNEHLLVLKGFYPKKEFYSPNYDKEEDAFEDNRSTLYWNPEVVPDENGQVTLTFFTADIRSTYLIQIEGVSQNGLLGFKETKFKVF